MYLSNIDTMDALVAYRQESVAASVRASRQDSLLLARLRVRIGITLIRIGERLGSDWGSETSSPATAVASPPLPRRNPSCA